MNLFRYPSPSILQSHPLLMGTFLRILDTPSYHEAIVHDHSLP